MAQGRNIGFTLLAGINQFLVEDANNALFTRVNLTQLVTVLAGFFDQSAGGSIDNGCYPAGLCIKQIFLHHNFP